MNFINFFFKLILVLLTIKNFVFGDTQCPTVPLISQDDRINSNKLRLVQYNVEWLFIDQYNNCPGSGCTWSNQSEVQIHMNYVADVINDLEPDILNLCEVEGCDELNQLINLTNNKFRPYLIKGTDSSTGQNVGMLTLIDPIENLYRTEEHIDYPIDGSSCGYSGSAGSQGVSKHYITRFNIGNMVVSMISAHLLAIPTDPTRCVEREAQAQVLQNKIFNLYLQGDEIILIGDINDYDNRIEDMNNDQPTSRVLDILKGIGGVYGGMYELYNVAQNIEKSDRYTEWYDQNSNCKVESNEFSMIDHILVTPNLYSKIAGAWIYHEYPQYCNTYDSDHYPVVVDFYL